MSHANAALTPKARGVLSTFVQPKEREKSSHDSADSSHVGSVGAGMSRGLSTVSASERV